jgi:hypothetical protein
MSSCLLVLYVFLYIFIINKIRTNHVSRTHQEDISLYRWLFIPDNDVFLLFVKPKGVSARPIGRRLPRLPYGGNCSIDVSPNRQPLLVRNQRTPHRLGDLQEFPFELMQPVNRRSPNIMPIARRAALDCWPCGDF